MQAHRGRDEEFLCGYLFEGKHIFPVRIYHEDTDVTGFAYHATYVRFAERARSSCLSLAGIKHATLMQGAHPLFLVVHKISTTFLLPAYLEDVMFIETQPLKELGTHKARLWLQQTFFLKRDGERQKICSLEVEIVAVSVQTLKPLPLPSNILRLLGAFFRNT